MSGRDFKTFLASHQHQIGQKDSKLVSRFLSGQKPLYKPVDYEKIKAVSKIRHSSANNSLKKIEKLQEASKQNKNAQLLHEHKRIWESEVRRLKRAAEKIETELEALEPSSLTYEHHTTPAEELNEEIIDLRDAIRFDLKDFVKNTLTPVHQLCDDLQVWIKKNTSELAVGCHDRENEQDILETIKSVKTQQATVLQKLYEEQEKIECELQNTNIDSQQLSTETGDSTYRSESVISSCSTRSVFSVLSSTTLPSIVTGVPAELQNTDCPDEALREACYMEFDSLDEKYACEIENVEEKYKDVIDRQPTNGWLEADYVHFVHIMDQYRGVAKNRRKLYLDRLQREFAHKSLKEIKDAEEFWFRTKSLRNQLRSLLNAWKRDREDLTLTVFVMFDDAKRQYEAQQISTVQHMKQRFICNFLHEKLLQYHTERLEVMSLEAEQQAQRQIEEEKGRKVKEKKEKERRLEDKRKILLHKEQQESHSARLREVNRMRLLELQEKHARERQYNLERVQYRQEIHNQKMETKRLDKQRELDEKREKETRLKRMTEHISANVENDPLRVHEPTKTYLARVADDKDGEKEIQEPLFNVYTYTVDQVAKDKRLKIENALRRANLHMTEYGRTVLKAAPPPSKPRKDMESNSVVWKS